MKSIRKMIIHLLGGLTIEESRKSDENCIGVGKWYAFHEIQAYCRDLNGQPAEVWCDEVYKFIAKRIERMMKEE